MLSSTDNEAYDNPIYYRKLVGALQYLTITRPDIAFVVNHLCQLMYNPRMLHFKQLQCVLHYIKATPRQCILIRPRDLTLTTYSDSD